MKLINYLKANKEIIILIILPVVFFRKILFSPTEIIYQFPSDINTYSVWKMYVLNSINNFGELPLWNNLIFSGNPYLGDPHSAMFYPINLIYLIFPIDNAFGYIFFINFILMGIFTYLFSRTIKLDKFSSLTASIVSTFGGTFVILIYPGHIHISDGIIWFPALLLTFELAIQKRQLWIGILSGFVISMMIFSGFIQIAVFSILSSMIYFLIRSITEYKSDLKLLIKMLFIPFIAVIVGALLSSIQLIPDFELSKYSTRRFGLGYEFASDFFLHPYQTLSFIFPHFFGSPIDATWWGKGNFWTLSAYIGIFPIIFSAIAILFKRNNYVKIFLILTIFSLLFAFGNHGPLFQFFFNYVPGFDNFRAPARILFVFSFSLSMLTGFGVNYFIDKKNGIKKQKNLIKVQYFILPILIASIILIIFLFLKTDNLDFYEKYVLRNSYAVGIDHYAIYQHFRTDLIVFSTVLFSFLTILYLRIKNITSVKFIKILILLIIIMDLWFYGYKFLITKKSNETYISPNALKIIKKDQSKFRVFDLSGELIELLGRSGIESITGNDSARLYYYRDYLWLVGPHEESPYESFFQIEEIKNLNVLKLLNVKYIISKKEITLNGIEKIYKDKNYIVYEIENFLPRSFLKKHATDTFPSNKKSDKVTITKYSPNEIILWTESKEKGLLFISEIWYPGWKVYINDKEKEIQKTNSIFRSVSLKKGKNDVRFIYSPTSYKIGKIITISTLLFSVLYLLFRFKK